MTTLALRAHKKGLELACHVAADVPDALVGDPGRLRQVLVNLVGNAIKFTERGEVVVRVEVAVARRATRSCLHFAVRDTGIGIPADKQQTLFEAFAQADTLDDAQVRRHRPGPDDLGAAGRADGRPDLGRERGRPGQHVPLHGAVRPGARPGRSGRLGASPPGCTACPSWSWTTTPPTGASSRRC